MRRRFAALATVATLLLSLALPSAAGATKTVSIGGPFLSDTVLATLAETYLATQCRDTCFRFSFLTGGDESGIRRAAAGKISIGTVARDTPPAREGLRFTEFARQAVCVATNPGNPLPSLTRAQIGAIFSGETRNWSDVPGATATGPIHLFLRGAQAWPIDPLERRLGVTRLAPNSEWGAYVEIASDVPADPAAITFVSPAAIEEGVHFVALGGVPCTRHNVETGLYPASTSLFWITRGAPKGATKKFLDWARNSPRARHSIASEAFPVR